MMSTNWDLLIENHFNKKGNEEEKLSLLKNKARDFEERIIPEMMQEAGVSKLKLEDGTEVECRENRILFFDPSKEHASTTCTDQTVRSIIIVNYF